MNRAVKVTASVLGISAGLASIEHGYFEVLQGNTRPDALFIVSMGPPCDPEIIWNACEPALTIIPNLFTTGILAIIFGILTIIWSLGFLQRKHGGGILILLSIGMLLFGGGLFPPFIGIVAGMIATRIYKPLNWWRGNADGIVYRFLATLYPGAIIIYLCIVFGQVVVGYFFNDFLKSFMGLTVLFILGFLLLSALSALAHDAQNEGVPNVA
jgi:hypothetical protein